MTARAVLLLPLLAVAADQSRATLFCAPGAESCLEAAGRGWLGVAGIALLAVYALVLAVGIARAAGRGSTAAAGPPRGSGAAGLPQPGAAAASGLPARRAGGRSGRLALTARLWMLGTAGVAALCGAQALLAGAVGDPAALGGGWAELLALCAVAGGVVAATLRAAPAAAALVHGLRPGAPRTPPAHSLAPSFPALAVRAARAPRTPATAGRAPPLP